MKRYATTAAVVTVNGVVVSVAPGQEFDADDPVVREHPGLFGSPVEEATAVPGAKRSTRR